MNKSISGHEFRNTSEVVFFFQTINEKYILFAGTSTFLQDMNLQLFNFSNTTASEGLRQPNTFLKIQHQSQKLISVPQSYQQMLPKETLPNELHLLKTQKQVRDHLWYLMLKYCKCCQVNWANQIMHMSVDVFYIQEINVHKHTMGPVIKKFQI